MNHPFVIAALCVLSAGFLSAEVESPDVSRAKHKEGAAKVADEQDELSADAQQLVIEQTVPKIIELLSQVKTIMDEATDGLAKADTGGKIIAAQTEIIEKILAAAKEKQGQGGGSKAGGAMMDMAERMAGKDPDGDQKGKSKDGKPSDQGGGGVSGMSDTGNEGADGRAGGKSEARRVPKAAGGTNLEIPEEFRKALDAYNRGAEKKVK